MVTIEDRLVLPAVDTSVALVPQRVVSAERGREVHLLYAIWSSMKGRCSNPADKRFDRYGGRGIKVCDRWRSDFFAFVIDMGPRPSVDHSIDRIDLDGDYTPENCRWATRTEQARNKSNNRLVTFQGVTKPLAAWAEDFGLTYTTLRLRLNRGWSVARSLGVEGQTHCRHGHELTEENTGRYPDGRPRCRICMRAHQQSFRARKRALRSTAAE